MEATGGAVPLRPQFDLQVSSYVGDTTLGELERQARGFAVVGYTG